MTVIEALRLKLGMHVEIQGEVKVVKSTSWTGFGGVQVTWADGTTTPGVTLQAWGARVAEAVA